MEESNTATVQLPAAPASQLLSSALVVPKAFFLVALVSLLMSSAAVAPVVSEALPPVSLLLIFVPVADRVSPRIHPSFHGRTTATTCLVS